MCIDILQDRRRPLPERIFLLGMALQDLMAETDVPRWLERTAGLMEGADTGSILRQDKTTLSMFLAHNANILYILTHSEKKELLDLIDSLGLERDEESGQITIQGGSYLRAQARFHDTLEQQEWFWENLMVTIFYSWRLPDCNSPEQLWHSYVSFCNLYSIYRFLSVMSCRESASGDREELFRLLVTVSRTLIHSSGALDVLCDRLFQTNSATLAHMAILLGN